MKIGYEAKRIYHNASGLGNFGRNLIRSLAQEAPQHHYYLYNYKPGRINFEAGASVQEKRPKSANGLLANIWRQRLVSGRAQKDGVEIFHGLAQELPYGLAKKKIKAIVTVHDLIFLRYPNLYKKIDRNIYLKKLKHACKVADLVVAVSRQTRQDLIDYLQVPAEKIVVIYQGCDPLYWEQHQNNIVPLLEKYQLPERFALFVGTLEPRKNPTLVAEACAELEIPLVLVGKPTAYWQKFTKASTTHQQSFWQHLRVESTRDLATLYTMADLFVYPSIFEGFGIPVLEALATETPVITSHTSALPEVAGPGAQLIDVNSKSELKKALAFFWQDEQARESAINQGNSFVKQFQDTVIAKQWLDTYEKVLAK